MILDKMVLTTNITSGAAASAIALTFDASNSPMKVVRFYGTMGSFTSAVSGNINILAETGELLWQSATVAPTGAFNLILDVDVFPNDSVRFTTTGDVGSGATPTITAKMHLER